MTCGFCLTGNTSASHVLDQNVVDTLITVRGRVVDENGEPLSGANVVVKGTKSGTTTNANGEFELKNVNDDDVVIVSSIGFEAQELKVAGRNSIVRVSLKITNSQLDEVQIIAYGTTTKRLSTGNIGSVKAEDIEKQPVNNPLLALQGRVFGLSIRQANVVTGSDVKIRIQGRNSFRQMVVIHFMLLMVFLIF